METGDAGVGLYLSSHLKNRLVTKSSLVSVEYIFVEIRFPRKILLVGLVYKPPSIQARNYGLGHWKKWLPGYGNVYLMGDFNVNLQDLFETFFRLLKSFRRLDWIGFVLGFKQERGG
jgi:hypothetical protein